MNNKENIKEDLFNWAHKLKDKKVNGKRIYDLFEYEGINLWWFSVIGICQEMNQYQKEIPIPKKELNLRKNIFPKIELFIDGFICLLSRVIYSSYKKKKKPIAFVTMDRYWKEIYDPITGKNHKVDDFFESIIEESKDDKNNVISVGELQILQTRSFESLKNLFDRRLKRSDNPYVSIESFWGLKSLIKQFKARRHFKKIWSEIKYSPDLKACLYEKGDLLGERLMNFFEYYFKIVLPRKIKLLEMSRNFISSVEPKSIVLQNERGGWEQLLIYAAKEKGIKTIALQHGVVYKLHEGYFQMEENKEDKTKPDLFSVYGPEIKNILVEELHYKPGRVSVVGQPRYDKIKNYFNPIVKKRFFERHNLDMNKKLILIATQPLVPSLRESYFNEVIDTVKDFKDLQVAVKPHPAETDLTIYFKKIEAEKIKTVILDKKDDTFEAIASSDYFTTFSSTVALEAMMFKKPVFIFNFSNSLGTLPWTEEKAAIEFKNLDEAKRKIREFMEDETAIKSLIEREAEFLKKQYYKLDGKATERVYKLIKELSKHGSRRK